MISKRIETGTPEGDALGFYEHLFPGWLETVDENRLYLTYIISRNRNKGIPRPFPAVAFVRP